MNTGSIGSEAESIVIENIISGPNFPQMLHSSWLKKNQNQNSNKLWKAFKQLLPAFLLSGVAPQQYQKNAT